MKYIDYLPLNSLIHAEYNPNYADHRTFLEIQNSIQRFGVVDPAIVNLHENRKNIVVGGNHRVMVAKDMIEKGLAIFPGTDKEIPAQEYFANGFPCITVNLPFEQEKELNIRLNKNKGQFDENILKEFFDFESLKDWGFDDSELTFFQVDDTEMESPKDDSKEDKEAQKREAVASKMHDIWAEWAMDAIENDKIQMEKERQQRWIDLAETPYSELSEDEKEKDREQADKILETLK